MLLNICSNPTDGTSGPLYQSMAKSGIPTSACIDVKFHNVRLSNGTLGYNASNLNVIQQTLDQAYNQHNIFFNYLPVINTINNTVFYDISGQTEADFLTDNNNDSSAINIYLVNSIQGNNGFNGSSLSIVSNNILLRNDKANSNVIIHEMGHAFGLYHTYEEDETCFEVVPRINCDTCGDLLCDTEANRGINGFDSNANYNPDHFNYMSDNDNVLWTRFSDGQVERMLEMIETQSKLIFASSNVCVIPTIDQIDFLCPNSTQLIEVEDLGSSTVTWQTSSNVDIVSFAGNQIVVEPTNGLVTGEAWVEANVTDTGQNLRTTFWIGEPQFNRLGMISSGNFMLNTNNWYQLTATYSDFNIDVDGPLNYEWNIPFSQVMSSASDNSTIAINPSQPGTYIYKLKVTNGCGETQWFNQQFQVTINSGGGLMITPAGL